MCLVVNNMLAFHKWRYLGKNGDYKLLQFLPFFNGEKSVRQTNYSASKILIMTNVWLVRNKKMSFKKMANIIYKKNGGL